MKRLGLETLDQALTLLGEVLAQRGQPPCHFVNSDELLAAARWSRSQDPSEGFRLVLADLLNHLGHADLIDRL